MNNIRLRNKLLLFYFLAVFIPVLFTNLFFYSVTTHSVRKQKEQDISLELDRIQNAFRAKIDAAVGVSSIVYADGWMNESLEREYPDWVEYLDAYDAYIRPTLNRYAPLDRSIQDLTIYTDNPTLLGAGGISPLTADVKQSAWYDAVMSAASSDAPLFVHTRSGSTGSGDGAYSLIRKLNMQASNRYAKILKIDFHPDTFKQVMDNRALQGDLYLVNQEGVIEFTTASSNDWRQQPIPFASVDKPEGALVFTKTFPTVDYLRGWSIIGIMPEHQILAEIQKSQMAVVYLALVNLLLPTLIIIWIAKSLHDRLLRILKQMKQVKNQRFEPIDHVESTDEIGQLTVEFNRMTGQIKRLIDDVYLADIQAKDLELQRRRAQLHALQSQINPHFLFNALEALRMRSLMKREEETARIISSMAKIFRKSLAWGNDWVTVRQETDLIGSFLEIQQYRFGKKLVYSIEVSEAAALCRIPKMIFVPFVENASIHGIEAIHEQGVIQLEVSAEGEELVFLLRDNGIGMEEDKLRYVLSERSLEEDSEEHVGIRNVIARLQLFYGDAARLDIESTPGAGTTVKMRLPQQLNFSK
ncbi:sensor histidine kinase [Paenibacillus radicis (ex Gao et al. 2016)]|uniref:Sensor histidine kinase n=1 Tax=Paenibacillus radicis (ex Gao et al. 2016) TaxID=1737354 RepID=A0A917GXQ7_9BACL|nr:sensor histidine kinase [Paenibacillus radicis (ex Gao et al. 2016)]GGG60737.1 sensor histidine kinase [Paenibacillus radicis (ex Gao et al. 2016)]